MGHRACYEGPAHTHPPLRISPCGLMPCASSATLPGIFAHVYLSCVSWSLELIGGLLCVAAHAEEVGEKKGMAMRMLAGTTRQDPTPCVPSLRPCAHQPMLTYPTIPILLTALVVWCVRSACLCQTQHSSRRATQGEESIKKRSDARRRCEWHWSRPQWRGGRRDGT
jgi:hypothetical protein